MVIEIRDSKDQTVMDFTGDSAKEFNPLLMKTDGTLRIAKYPKGNCSQIVITTPQKFSLNKLNGIYLWEGYKINFWK